MDLAPWAERLAQCAAGVDVAGAAEASVAMEQGPRRVPAVYLLPKEDQARDNTRSAGGHSQQVTTRFAALIVVRNVADPQGGRAHAAVQPVRDQVDRAFLAWTPDSAEFDPAEYVSGNHMKFEGGFAWWMDLYQTRFYKRRNRS